MQSAGDIRVSYLITTRNRADVLERTLENVREFIEPQDELIIIDGQSTDRTREVVEGYRDLVTVFVSEKDSCEAHAFNKGLFRARGRLLKPITDDNYFYTEAMRQLVYTMETTRRSTRFCAVENCGVSKMVGLSFSVTVSFRLMFPGCQTRSLTAPKSAWG